MRTPADSRDIQEEDTADYDEPSDVRVGGRMAELGGLGEWCCHSREGLEIS